MKPFGFNIYGDVVFTTDIMTQRRPKIVEAFLKASVEGWQTALNDPRLAVEDTLKEKENQTVNNIDVGVDPTLEDKEEEDKMRAIIKLMQPSIPYTMKMDDTNWVALQSSLSNLPGENEEVDITKVETSDYLPDPNAKHASSISRIRHLIWPVP